MIETILNDSIAKMADTIRILMYKKDSTIFSNINFNNDAIFFDPLLFIYFNYFKDIPEANYVLKELIQSHFLSSEPLKLDHLFSQGDLIYIPKLGYCKKTYKDQFTAPIYIENTSIEILTSYFPLLKDVLPVPSEDLKYNQTLFNTHINHLTKACNHIKTFIPEHFKLIEMCCKKIFMFKTNPDNTNSFATINAHGMAFFNVYQEDYDEVFFIDDIAHQTGHIILSTLCYDRKLSFKIDDNIMVEDIVGRKDHRSVYTLFHALYTYYTTLLCIDKCIKGGCFNTRQLYEAKGRVGFYLNKYQYDILLFEEITKHFSGIERILGELGINILKQITNSIANIEKNWNAEVSLYSYKQQTYNFNYQLFISENPMVEFPNMAKAEKPLIE